MLFEQSTDPRPDLHIPANVKLWESPGKAGGLPRIIIPVGIGASIMLVVALLVNNIPQNRKYPEFWL